jgi:predicted RNA-binding Zn-ribbon protein involved in translation (DUF1610 family)
VNRKTKSCNFILSTIGRADIAPNIPTALSGAVGSNATDRHQKSANTKMELRTKDSYQNFVYDFIQFDILVTCPNCKKQAIVKPENFSFRNVEKSDVKVICPNCGYNRKLLDKPDSILYSSNGNINTGRHYVIGGAIDPFFYLPLWLKTDFEEHTLWAYNLKHLDFLRSHIEAKLRERNGQELFNKSLGSRLPKWMTSKKNREVLLKKISELQNK